MAQTLWAVLQTIQNRNSMTEIQKKMFAEMQEKTIFNKAFKKQHLFHFIQYFFLFFLEFFLSNNLIIKQQF